MIDLETLGTEPGAAILSIGAVAFDAQGVRERFYVNVDALSCHKAGLQTDPATVRWWMDQATSNPAAVAALRRRALRLPVALELLAVWLRDYSPKADMDVWANSPAFDCALLKNAYSRVNMPLPWKYYRERDYRTIRELNRYEVILPDAHVAHDALADAEYQVKMLLAIFHDGTDSSRAA